MFAALLLIAATESPQLAVVARLVAPATSSTVALAEVEAAAFAGAAWFVDLRLLAPDQTGRALENDLRACATDNRCIGARLEQRGIDRALYVVVSLETGFVTAEVLDRRQRGVLATEAVEIKRGVEPAVHDAVISALSAAGHTRGALLIVDVAPRDALLRVDGAALSPGEMRALPAGRHVLEASAPGFEARRREVELTAGEELAVDLQLTAEGGITDSWWLWSAIAVAAAAAVIVPVVAVNASDAPERACYSSTRTLCAGE